MRIIASDAGFSGDAQQLDDGAVAELNMCEFTREQVSRLICWPSASSI